MKTKTDLRKTAVRTAAVVVSFVLVSFTVSAQEFWKKLLTNSSFNEIAIAMVEPVDVESATERTRTLEAEWTNFDRAFDPALELEGWMSSKKHFGVDEMDNENEAELSSDGDLSFLDLEYSTDESEPLVLETWMVQDGLWMN
ncbi:MAG: hypothetical protein ACOC10_11580 [Bacteroidota bacterium]